MMKNYLLLFLLFFTGIYAGPAQTITTEKGLTTISFNVPEGKIKVYLPDDIRAGDIISGTVSAEPGGKNEKQFKKNGEKLLLYFIDFNGQKFPVTKLMSPVQFNISEKAPSLLPLILVNEKGNGVGQLQIACSPGTNTRPPAGTACNIPAHALTAAPLRITGPFDGNSSNTRCTVGTVPATVLAESPGQSILQFPANSNGIQQLRVQENGQKECTLPVSGVDMELNAGKLNLLKGEQTYIHVRITGLEHLPGTAWLRLKNRSPGVINLFPSDQFAVPLTADSIHNGTYDRRFDIQSLQSGNFNVDVNLDLPENRPPVFADVRKPVGGKRDEKVLTAGTRTALNIAMKKWADANTEGKNPIDFQCENCITCIKGYTTESNAGDVGELGWGIITSFLSGGAKLVGGLLEKVKDVADKGGDIYKAIKQLIADGKIQVIGFKEKWCDNNENCQVTGIIVYDVATGCADAEYRCRGNKLCCPFAETTYKMHYCFDKDGAVIDDTISITITH